MFKFTFILKWENANNPLWGGEGRWPWTTSIHHSGPHHIWHHFGMPLYSYPWLGLVNITDFIYVNITGLLWRLLLVWFGKYYWFGLPGNPWNVCDLCRADGSTNGTSCGWRETCRCKYHYHCQDHYYYFIECDTCDLSIDSVPKWVSSRLST